MKTDDRDRWRRDLAYQVQMLGETINMVATLVASPDDPRRNVICESRVLHARNLCDFCTPRKKDDDLRPEDMFDKYHTDDEYSRLRDLVNDVKAAYQTNSCSPGDSIQTGTFDAGSSVAFFIEATFRNRVTSELKSPKWAFDKGVAHITKDRGDWFDYQPFLDCVEPKIRLLVDEIRRLEKAQGRDFPSLASPMLWVPAVPTVP